MTPETPHVSPARHPWLWALALLLMLSAAIYQRITGPTNPKRVQVEIAGERHRFKLIRSETSTTDARVAVPNLGMGVSAKLVFRRFPTQEPWTTVELKAETIKGTREWAAYLPKQPAAGKLEYHLELTTPEGPKRLPETEEIRIRYKDPVPAPLLIAHVICMFFGVLFGLRTGLAALFDTHNLKRLAWETLALLTVGGMILGPLVQKHAFGALWTGWPYGYDLTDNKTLIMWLVWIVAISVMVKGRERINRVAALLAALAMAVVYVIPHSARGSQLDYSKVQQGVDAKHAVTTGK
ncbi:MAG: hypothetical protein IPN59_15185 [Holophaga sp.]|nr:hypothetical protein [Holophaga sp.]